MESENLPVIGLPHYGAVIAGPPVISLTQVLATASVGVSRSLPGNSARLATFGPFATQSRFNWPGGTNQKRKNSLSSFGSMVCLADLGDFSRRVQR